MIRRGFALRSPRAGRCTGGTIAIFADPLGENCYPEHIAPGLFQIHVVHVNPDGTCQCNIPGVRPICRSAASERY